MLECMKRTFKGQGLGEEMGITRGSTGRITRSGGE